MKRKYLLFIVGMLIALMFVGCGVKEEIDKASDNLTKQVDKQGESADQPKGTDEEATEWKESTVKNNMEFKGIVSNGSIYVGYGLSYLAYSYDGLDWKVVLEGDELYLHTITYMNGIFFASSSFETYYQSKDGITWTSYDVSDIGFDQTYTGVLTEDKFVSFDSGGYLVTSQDGINWEKYRRTIEPNDSINMQDTDGWGVTITEIIYENGKYFAGLFDCSLLVGNGLEDWELVVFEDNPIEAVVDIEIMGNKIICAGLSDVTAIDIDSLAQIKTGEDDGLYITLEKYEDKIITVKDSGEVLISSDGVSWSVLFERPKNYLDISAATLIDDMVILYAEDGQEYYRKIE